MKCNWCNLKECKSDCPHNKTLQMTKKRKKIKFKFPKSILKKESGT